MSEDQALALRQPIAITITAEQRELAKRTIAKDLDDNEFALFVYNCTRQGIHPLDGLLVPIKRNDSESGGKRLTFVTTVDLLRSRAQETDECAGIDDPVFEYVEGLKYPAAATVNVYRFVQGQRCMFVATARWDEYLPNSDKQKFMWLGKPHVMLGKCAEALALRKAFPKQLAGLYIGEEMERYDAGPTINAEPVKETKARPKNSAGGPVAATSTSSPSASPHNPSQQSAPSKSGENHSGQAAGGEPVSEGQLKRLFAIQKSVGASDDLIHEFLKERHGIGSRKDIPKSPGYTYGVYEALIDYIDPDFQFHTDEWPVKEIGWKKPR